MIIEDQLDRGAGRISGVETLEEFDELPAAVAVSDERMNLPGKQVEEFRPTGSACHDVCTRNPAPRSAWTPGLGGKSGAVVSRWPKKNCRLFVVRSNDRHSLDGFARLGGRFVFRTWSSR